MCGQWLEELPRNDRISVSPYKPPIPTPLLIRCFWWRRLGQIYQGRRTLQQRFTKKDCDILGLQIHGHEISQSHEYCLLSIDDCQNSHSNENTSDHTFCLIFTTTILHLYMSTTTTYYVYVYVYIVYILFLIIPLTMRAGTSIYFVGEV